MERITETIEGKVLETFEREVPSAYIGRLVMEELQKVDPVAYVRFASVYREFKDVKEFQDELQAMVEAAKHQGGAGGEIGGKDTGGTGGDGKASGGKDSNVQVCDPAISYGSMPTSQLPRKGSTSSMINCAVRCPIPR